MKMYVGVEVCVHRFLTLVPDGGERLVSCSSRFNLLEGYPSTIWIEAACISEPM
jgi:hypothetical protein